MLPPVRFVPFLISSGGTSEQIQAKTITELILERVGPVIFETFLLEVVSPSDDSSGLPFKTSKPRKLLETIIHSRQGLPRNKSVKFQKLIPGNISPIH